MAHIRVVQDWRQMRFLPFIEERRLGGFLDTDPRTPVGLVPFWNEYRWRHSSPKETAL